MLMTTHRSMPWISGLMPTAFNTSREREAPIKKRVMVSVLRANSLMDAPITAPVSVVSSTYVLKIMARMKKKINQGMLMRCPLLLKIKEVKSAIGIIQSARVSLIVVAIRRASSPYAAPAPTTELVSWMAMAAQVPKSYWLIFKACPIAGKMKSAMALRINMVPKATDMSLSLAFKTGPTAAMALPPQMAVPELMR